MCMGVALLTLSRPYYTGGSVPGEAFRQHVLAEVRGIALEEKRVRLVKVIAQQPCADGVKLQMGETVESVLRDGFKDRGKDNRRRRSQAKSDDEVLAVAESEVLIEPGQNSIGFDGFGLADGYQKRNDGNHPGRFYAGHYRHQKQHECRLAPLGR